MSGLERPASARGQVRRQGRVLARDEVVQGARAAVLAFDEVVGVARRGRSGAAAGGEALRPVLGARSCRWGQSARSACGGGTVGRQRVGQLRPEPAVLAQVAVVVP